MNNDPMEGSSLVIRNLNHVVFHSMAICTINCDGNEVDVYTLLYLIFKILLNKPNDNYCRGMNHKPPFNPSECNVGPSL